MCVWDQGYLLGVLLPLLLLTLLLVLRFLPDALETTRNLSFDLSTRYETHISLDMTHF